MLSQTTPSSSRFFLALHRFLHVAKPTKQHRSQLSRIDRSSQAPQRYSQAFFTTLPRHQKEPLISRTHYDLFADAVPSGPPPAGAFAIDVSKLRQEFLKLQAQAHPDRHQGENKRKAEGASMRINEAYKTLQNPLSRAQYLLSLRGVDVTEDETTKVDDPELLLEVLDMREMIEEVEEEADLIPLKKMNAAHIEGSMKILNTAFEADDIDTAKHETVKLRYWINIKESLDGWENAKPVVLTH